MYRSQTAPAPRKGIILLVVLALLTLFTIIGISFVLYADAAALQARNAKDSNANNQPDMEPEQCLSMFLDQFIYDVRDDASGVSSSMRGHGLSRNMYGFNYTWSDVNFPNSGLTPNLITQTGNNAPFIGVGRLHYQGPPGLTDNTTNAVVDDWKLINYMYFASDNFIRDPERYGYRNALRGRGQPDNRGPYLASANVPYTYPDLNNYFLGAIDGGLSTTDVNGNPVLITNLITPSFHREWLFGRLDDPNNPNWTNAVGKYLTVRPRPVDHYQDPVTGNYLFPYPVDRGGDVKNLIGYYGGCDSSWMDIGAPVMTTPDGRKYKMLVAPLILELDGRLNLLAHGNIMGSTPTGSPSHGSSGGLGPWEVNLSRVLAPANPDGTTNTTEWLNLFLGNSAAPNILGKYGPNKVPVANPLTFPNTNLTSFPTNNVANSIPSPHAYGQINYRIAGTQSHIQIPSASQNLQGNLSCFPVYKSGYDNANPGPTGTQALQSHPLLYGYYAPALPSLDATGKPSPYYNRSFRLSNMERFFRANDTGYEALTSDFERLMPLNFNNPNDPAGSLQRLSLVTPYSGDRNQPGISPYIWDPTQATYVVNPAALDQAPVGTAPVFPTPASTPPQPKQPGDFTGDWRNSAVATNAWGFNGSPVSATTLTSPALPRLDLNYPFPGRTLPASITTPNPAGLTPYPSTGTVDPNLPAANQRFDATAYAAQFQQAQSDRQYLARQLYLRLLAVTGLSPSGAVANQPTTLELQPRRWLAQLAVNMVDFIDNDDISTAFNFYTAQDANPLNVTPAPAFDPSATATNLPGPNFPLPLPGNPPAPTTPLYWVFGTELPRVVINEALMQYNQPPLPMNQTTVPANTTFINNVWVELYNPMELTPSTNPNVSGTDTQPVALGMPALAALGQSQASTVDPRSSVNAYGAYRLLVADQNMLTSSQTTKTPPTPITTIADNDNVLGLPLNIRAQTADSDFAANTVIQIKNIGTNTWANTDPTNPLSLSPQGFLLVTPPGVVETTATNAANNSLATIAPTGNAKYPNGLVPPTGNNLATSPANLVLQTSNLQFQSTVQNAWTPTSGTPMTVTPSVDNTMLKGNGATVMLQRLANPHIPYNPNPTWVPAGQSSPTVNPWYNPYVTVDYVSNIPLYNSSNPSNLPNPPATPAYSSVGKKQPYTGFMNPTFAANVQPNPSSTTSVVQNQTQAISTTVKHTFGARNNPLPNSNGGPYNWLTHLDRMLISPVELLHVSQYPPHQLTQKFMLTDPTTNTTAYQHAPVSTWYDETRRLYRVFEFLETRDRMAGTTDGYRTAGKININAIWDYQTFLALCDPQGGNSFAVSDVQTLWNQLIKSRSPNYQQGTGWYQVGPTNMVLSQVATGSSSYPIGPTQTPTAAYQVDRPFIGLAQGAIGSPGAASTQYPNGQGIRDTIFRPGTNGQMFVLPTQSNTNPNLRGDNPYMNHQLLTKIFNNVTTRSNVFAVYLTVGFFEVKDTTTTPVKLGAEMNASEGRAIRHRMFAVVDRTVLANNPYPNTTAANAPAPKQPFRPSGDTTGLVPYWAIIE